MPESYMLIAPEPQLKLVTELDDYNLGQGLSFRPLDQRLSRNLINLAKEKQCSDDCLRLLLESDFVFCVQIPPRSKKIDGSLLAAFIYKQIAQEILKRIFRCLLIFQWVPSPLFEYCWFLVSGTPDKIDIETTKMLYPGWVYIEQFTNIDWRFGRIEAEDINLAMKKTQQYWNKLSLLCHINDLKDIYIDKNVEKNCLQNAHKYVVGKLEELLKARFGPDIAISDIENNKNIESKNTTTNMPKLQIANNEKQKEWRLVGLGESYSNKLKELSHELDIRVLDKRLDRAFQFFTEAFIMPQPYRFIALTTCLESLFCTSNTEIAFQLASRIAWHLYSDNYTSRARAFTMAKRLYDLRSKIVHGLKYNPTKINEATSDLLILIRMALVKIIDDDELFSFFRDEKLCKKYLEGLNLGKPPDKGGTD